jgi:hypothetical protein
MAIQTLTGNQFEHGSAIDNTQTDTFVLTGPNNIVQEGAGNVKVIGVTTPTFGLDTASIVMLDSASATTDTITLDGDHNTVAGTLPTSALSGSTVSITATGAGTLLGNNTVALVNHGGTTTAKLAGSLDTVTLNSDATNVIATGQDETGFGGAKIAIGAPFDDHFGGSSKIAIAGSGNTVSVGDANTSVAGGTSGNTIALGDGKNSVSLTGTKNTISVGGGDNVINAGGSGAVVHILGEDGLNLPVPSGDDGLSAHPKDTVTIAGTGDLVTATYEDVTINGAGVTSAATVELGDGNNLVTLGGAGGDTVVVGNGFNHIHASGNGNAVTLGNGINQVLFSGNGNVATVKDATGVGSDSFQLQGGVGDTILLGMAGGAVAGTATKGVTTITQAVASANQVVINLVGGTGAITLGQGRDSVTANGDKSVITVGSGKDTITANGNGDVIKWGNGADTITANGIGDKLTGLNGASHVIANGPGDTILLGGGANNLQANGRGDTITVGGGANVIQADGPGDKIVAGGGNNTIEATGSGTSVTAGNGNNAVTIASNETVTLGSGNNTVTAPGTGDTITIAANALSKDTVAMGDHSSLRISGGTDHVSLAGADDTVSANNLIAGSQITGAGNGEMVFLGGNSSTGVHLNPVGTAEQITVQALGTDNAYSGNVQVSGWGVDDTMNLNGLGFTSFLGVLQAMSFGPTQNVLHLTGGGSIAFDNPTAFSASEFQFSTTHGLV